VVQTIQSNMLSPSSQTRPIAKPFAM